MTNAEWMAGKGKKLSGLIYRARKGGFDILHDDGKMLWTVGGIASLPNGADPRLAWLDMEHGCGGAAPLTDAEEGYLRMVTAPWRGRVQCVARRAAAAGSRIVIRTDDMFTELPRFATGTMYAGMEEDRWYSPEELGI